MKNVLVVWVSDEVKFFLLVVNQVVFNKLRSWNGVLINSVEDEKSLQDELNKFWFSELSGNYNYADMEVDPPLFDMKFDMVVHFGIL
jgi:hypothetical protein